MKEWIIFLIIIGGCLCWMAYQKDQECYKKICPVGYTPKPDLGLCYCVLPAKDK